MEQIPQSYSSGCRCWDGHLKVATKFRVYDTNLSLSDKDKQEKTAKSNWGIISFGEAMTGRLEAHNFNFNICVRTTTRDKKGKGKDDKSIGGITLAGDSFMTTWGIATTTTTKFHAANNLEEEKDSESFSSSIKSTQSYLVENRSGDNFHYAREELPTPDWQPGQEEQARDLTPTTIAANQTRWIANTVQDLGMNPEEDKDIGSAGTEDDLATDLAASATTLSLVRKTSLMAAQSRTTCP